MCVNKKRAGSQVPILSVKEPDTTKEENNVHFYHAVTHIHDTERTLT